MEFEPRYCLAKGQFLLTLGSSAMFQVVEFTQSPAAGKIGLECSPFALDFENDTSSIPSAAAFLPCYLFHFLIFNKIFLFTFLNVDSYCGSQN